MGWGMSRGIDYTGRVDIPGSVLPPMIMGSLCHRFRGIVSAISGMIPGIEKDLRQSDMGIGKDIYGAAVFVSAASAFIIGAGLSGFFVAAISAKKLAVIEPRIGIGICLGIGLLLALGFGVRVLAYPKILLKRKTRDLERNLVFALRAMLVQVRSGVTLFDAISSVANGNNGHVSLEFHKAVRKIETGSYQNDALEELAENNPSLYFRRAIWQLVNGLKAGSDVSQVMESLVDTLSAEKSNQIKKYGNSLKMLSMMYMMIGAIVPALGLTLLIILSIFVKITDTVFWGMFAFLAMGQFMFIGIIKNSRPSLLGD